MSKQKSFVEKVLELLKGGDEAKITRFHKRVIKSNTRQINSRQEQLNTLEEKLEDSKEGLQDFILNIDISRIKTVEDVDSYISAYTNQYISLSSDIEDIEDEMETKRKEIEKFQDFTDYLK